MIIFLLSYYFNYLECLHTCFTISSYNVLTGAPVPPLGVQSFPESTQEVPAISKCNQGLSCTNSSINIPAVIVPALRPPVFLSSAKSPLYNFLKHLSFGSLQNFSP